MTIFHTGPVEEVTSVECPLGVLPVVVFYNEAIKSEHAWVCTDLNAAERAVERLSAMPHITNVRMLVSVVKG